MNPSTVEILGSLFFGLAILHTFLAGKVLKFSKRFPTDSFPHQLFHLFGEIEVVFALWGALLMLVSVFVVGWSPVIRYQQSLEFVEPFFVLAIMVLCSTRPILVAARSVIQFCSQILQRILRTPPVLTDLFVILFLGPLSGSLITEPAAMTVTALLLHSMLQKNSPKVLYALLAVLFVNVSIGGALTSFAAPPILMVAQIWQWDVKFVFMHFGWKSMIAVMTNAFFLVLFFRNELNASTLSLKTVTRELQKKETKMPPIVVFAHLLCLVGLVVTGHDQNAFLGIFLIFLALYSLTKKYQDSLRWKESFLVSVFLGGIIVFGGLQKWWLAPLLEQMTNGVLFLGSVALTAITDNAALTYLGAQVPGLAEASRFAMVAGAIGGGGLTLIANAPNAAGFSILGSRFPRGLQSMKLFIAALAPTAVALVCLWFL